MSVGGGDITAVCVRCKRELPASLFHYERTKVNGLYSWCKECKSKVAKARYDRKSKLKAKFGITPEDYEAMLAAQGRVCAICGRAETRMGNGGQRIRDLSVDHCHVTGKVRGLLCAGCNKGLGHFADRPEWLETAAAYLRRSA